MWHTPSYCWHVHTGSSLLILCEATLCIVFGIASCLSVSSCFCFFLKQFCQLFLYWTLVTLSISLSPTHPQTHVGTPSRTLTQSFITSHTHSTSFSLFSTKKSKLFSRLVKTRLKIIRFFIEMKWKKFSEKFEHPTKDIFTELFCFDAKKLNFKLQKRPTPTKENRVILKFQRKFNSSSAFDALLNVLRTSGANQKLKRIGIM